MWIIIFDEDNRVYGYLHLAGLKESITDAQSRVDGLAYTVAYTYNGLGQKVKETYPNAYYSYTYDDVGNLLTTSVNGILKSSTKYDLLIRAISITDGKSNVTTQKWNAFDKLAEVTTP